MTLIVENGTGLSNAESYASVADADAYLAAYGVPATWAAADDAAKEIALRKATRYLDAVYAHDWPGCVKNPDQALAWPRYGAERQDGVCLDSASVPTAVKQATSYMAARATEEDIYPDTTKTGIAAESFKAGPVEKSVEYIGEKSVFKQYSVVEGLLELIAGADSCMIPVVRG